MKRPSSSRLIEILFPQTILELLGGGCDSVLEAPSESSEVGILAARLKG